MLGTSVPPEMLAALGAESFEDVTYDGDDEDLMKDPSVQIDMRVSRGIQCNNGGRTKRYNQAHIVNFLRESAGNNTNNFSGIVDQLKPEEIMVVKKAIS